MRFLSCENRVKPGSRPEGVTAHHAFLIDNWDAPLSEHDNDRAARYDALKEFLTWLDNWGKERFTLVTGRTDPCCHDLVNPCNDAALGRIFHVPELFDLLQ